MHLAGTALMVLGLAVMACGIIGLIRFRGFYRKLLAGALLDTAGLLLLLFGTAVRQGFTFFSLKILLLALVVFLTAPLITHKIARSAYLSGLREEGAEDE